MKKSFCATCLYKDGCGGACGARECSGYVRDTKAAREAREEARQARETAEYKARFLNK